MERNYRMKILWSALLHRAAITKDKCKHQTAKCELTNVAVFPSDTVEIADGFAVSWNAILVIECRQDFSYCKQIACTSAATARRKPRCEKSYFKRFV